MKYTAFALIFIAFCFVASAQQVGPSPQRLKSIVVFKPSDFKCKPCEAFAKDEQALLNEYPGLGIHHIYLTRRLAEHMGINNVPLFVVGEVIVGYGEEEKARIKSLLSEKVVQ